MISTHDTASWGNQLERGTRSRDKPETSVLCCGGLEPGTPSRDKAGTSVLCRGGPEQSIQPKGVIERAVPYSVGDRVSGLFAVKSGRPRWFAGRVKRVNEDGTVHVYYDDGDEETNKNCVDVRPVRGTAERVTRSCPAVRRPSGNQASGTATLASTLCQGSDSEGAKEGRCHRAC